MTEQTAREAAPPEFYERVLDDRQNAQWQGIGGNPYAPLWLAAARLVPAGLRVVELGCGTGRLGSLLAPRAASYVGLDFAPRLVEEARRFAPAAEFRVADLRTDPIPEADAYVATEVLEHVDDDLALLRRLPRGALVVVSVPSFDSRSHVRFFPATRSAAWRYSVALDIDREERIRHGRRGAFFHLLRGTRR